MGPRDKADFANVLASIAAAAKMMSTRPCKRVSVIPPEGALRACAAGFFQGTSTSGIRKNSNDRTPPEEVCFLVPTIDERTRDSLKLGVIEGRGANLARELVNL